MVNRLLLAGVLVMLAVAARAAGANAIASTSHVTVSIDLSRSSATSSLQTGVTHVFSGIGISGLDAAAKANAENLVMDSVAYENRHIYGWGLGDPNPSLGVYDWSDLDAAVAELRKLGGVPVLTLCCAPGWMTTLGHSTNGAPDYNAAPTPAHYADFAHLAQLIAQRYPDITHYQIWNEFKGFNWDQVAFTNFYNTVYDALKAVNPSLIVGGPYLAITGGGVAGSGTSDAPIPPWQLSVLDYWLANKHGADFLNVDYSIVDYNATPPPLAQIMAATPNFEHIMTQLRAQPNYNNLPIWWSEDYCDVNQARLSYMSDAFQGACLASILYHELKSGAAVSLRWSPGGDAYEASGQPDIESLFSDPRVSGGGQPYPAYAAYKDFHDYFGPGTQLFSTTSSSPDIEVLASQTTTLLINKRATQTLVSLNGTTVGLAPYQVTIITTPTGPAATPTSVATATAVATQATSATPQSGAAHRSL